MIKYKLLCKECKKDFDSWFASSKEFEKLKKKKLLTCIICNSSNVEKNLMAPKVINSKLRENNNKELQKFKDVKKVVKNYQNFIKQNFDYVGNNFAYEARSIHYSDKKKEKGIYGTASKRDLKELKEEGIETQVFPWIEDKSN
tara:strand:+ start:221 stop:649 length:429 start_codon:yes stop_codon:yes gene_type:complete